MGTCLKANQVRADEARHKRADHKVLARMKRPTVRAVSGGAFPEHPVESVRKTIRRCACIRRLKRSSRSPCGCNRMAQRAGLSVSELKAEMSVENAMVSANCR